MPFDAYEDQMEQFGFIPANHAKPKFFPVKARRLFDETGHELPGWMRIVRDDTGKTLHVATDSYKIVTNEEAFGAFEDAIAKSTLDRKGLRIGTDYSREGARCFRQYLFPAHRVEVKQGVTVALRLLMFNSYDGSLRFGGRCGAYNFVCANTSISGKDYGQFSARHTAGIDIAKAIAGLTKAAEEHIETTRRWAAWPQIAITDQQAMAVCRDIPEPTNSLVDGLVHAWLRARDEDGPQSGSNAWTLFNVLTAWASHTAMGEGRDRGQARYERERRVATLIEGKVWREIVGA